MPTDPLRRAARLLYRTFVRPLVDRREWIAAHAIVLGLLAIGALIALGCTAIAAEVYDSVTEGDDLASLDRPILDEAMQWRTPSRNDAVTFFTDLSNTVTFPIVAAALLGAVALWRRSVAPLALGLVAIAVSLAMTSVGKAIVGRARPPRSDAVPPYEMSASFPSGHTLMTTTLMALLAYLAVIYLPRTWQRVVAVIACAGYAVAMGLSRVFLGHHWLTDVVAAWMLGVAWVAIVAVLHQTWLLTRNSRLAQSGRLRSSRADL